MRGSDNISMRIRFQRYKISRFLFIGLFLCLMAPSYSQTYQFPDTNFRNVMRMKYPFLMSGNNLNIPAAYGYMGFLDIDSANIMNASGIEFFINVRNINLNNNKLITIPQISNLSNLEYLYLTNNFLTSLPNLSNLINLRELHVHFNHLTSVPSSLAGLTNLRILFLSDNKLTTLPDFSSLINLEVLVLSQNKLDTLQDFSSMTQLKQLHVNETGIDTIRGISKLVNLEQLHCWGNNIRYMPSIKSGLKLLMLLAQDNPLKDNPDLSAYTNLRHLHLNNTGIDSIIGLHLLTNLEQLHCSGNKIKDLSGVGANTKLNTLIAKDNLLEKLPTLSNKAFLFALNVQRNKLTFEDILPLTGMFFYNNYIYTPQLTIGRPESLSVRKNDNLEIDLRIDQAISTNWYKWYKNGVAVDSNHTGILRIAPVNFSDAGIYSVTVTNPAIPSLILNSYDWVVRIDDCYGCSAVFSPDGDGVLDSYKIDHSGTVRIYDLGGRLIKEIHGPGEWDGTRTDGSLADAGYYVIMVNDRKLVNVSLMR